MISRVACIIERKRSYNSVSAPPARTRKCSPGGTRPQYNMVIAKRKGVYFRYRSYVFYLEIVGYCQFVSSGCAVSHSVR